MSPLCDPPTSRRYPAVTASQKPSAGGQPINDREVRPPGGRRTPGGWTGNTGQSARLTGRRETETVVPGLALCPGFEPGPPDTPGVLPLH